MSNPLLDLISHGESGVDGYNAYNRGTYIDAQGKPHIRPANEPIDFSSLTLGQVQDMQHLGHDDPKRLLAVGKYQVIPKTMDDAINKLDLDRDQLFTPELQDKIFSDYLIVDKRPDVHDYIIGKPGVTLEDAQRGMAKEWGSFGDPDNSGHSHYPSPNKSSITLEQSADALNQMRAQYKASIDRGLTSDAAWQAVTDSGPSQTQANPQHSTGPLRQGAHGDAVRAMQADLAALGYTDNRGHALQPDGHYGPNTGAAVYAFQSDHGLLSDGVAGRHTLEAIHGQRQLINDISALAPELDGRQRARVEGSVIFSRVYATEPAATVTPTGPAPSPTQSHMLITGQASRGIAPDTNTNPQLRDFSDSSHPQNALYNTLKAGFPSDTTPAWLACATAACYMSGIKQPDDLGDIYGNGEKIMFMSNSLFALSATIDTTQPPPTVQQTMQHVQQFDQQKAQRMSEIRTQSAHVNAHAQQAPTR